MPRTLKGRSVGYPLEAACCATPRAASVRWRPRVHVVGVILEILILVDDEGCDEAGFSRRVGYDFESAARAVERIAGASEGFHPELLKRARLFQDVMKGIREEAARQRDAVTRECKPAYQVVWDVSTNLLAALRESERYLQVTEAPFEPAHECVPT
jgi:hypothetical protein